MVNREKVFAVIPAFNEEKHISGVIEKARRHVDKVVVVDDGSKDQTYYAARKKDVTVLRHIVNLGKGAALKTGCDYALKKGATKIVVLDADSQHEPELIPRFVAALDNHEIVFGYRNLFKGMPLILSIGNKLINLLTTLLYHIKLRDTQCGFRAFTSEAYKKLRWKSSDYSMESEMIANAGKHKLKYCEIPIQTIYTDKYKGTTVVDGIKIVINMLLWKIRK